MPVLQFVQQLHSSQATMAAIVQSALQPGTAIADPLANANFRLNSLGVAGFFGGDIAVNGMATVIFFWRGWGGLYNTPGSLEIARRYGQLASKRIYRGLFPGNTRDPSHLFGLDGQPGPKFFAPQSGSVFQRTGHIAYLVARLAQRERPEALVRELARKQQQRITTPATVTVIDLNHLGESKPDATIHPALPYPSYGLFALFPTAVSLFACIACAWIGDWWTCSSILWGMLANGCACFVLGRGTVTFQHPEPASDAPRGDGILWAAGNAVVVIRGSERAVNTITRGRFLLQYDNRSPRGKPTNPPPTPPPHSSTTPPSTSFPNDTSLANGTSTADSTPLPDGAQDGVGKEEEAKREPDSAPEGGAPNSLLIGISGILLVVQFFAQLLLIPQVGLFGQVMFLLTVAASWGYNVLISSIDREDIQVRILRGRDILTLDEDPTPGRRTDVDTRATDGGRPHGWKKVQKFEFGTWTAMATFACLALRPKPDTPLLNSRKVLNKLIPNDTKVWDQWKDIVDGELLSERLGEPAWPEDASGLLKSIIGDAKEAFRRYREIFPPQPEAPIANLENNDGVGMP